MKYWPRIDSDKKLIQACTFTIMKMAKDELSADQGAAIVNALDKLLKMRLSLAVGNEDDDENELLQQARERASAVLCDPVVAGDEK
ncbi:MAG: hypothetical protein HN929_01965 [Chloroflexi bacterium]|nr:hypothetical protein [Chloroflexota bacterium]